MARTVYVPEAGSALNFPDGTSDQQIVNYVRTKYPAPIAPAPQEAGIGALESGFYDYLGRAEAAGGKAAQGMGIDWLATDLFDRSRANQEYASKYVPDVADISQIRGPGDLAKFAGSTLGQSATESAVGIGGAYAGMAIGEAIGSVVPGVGTVVGGIAGGLIGGAIAALPGFVGGNLQRQAEEQNIPLEQTSGYSASIGAAAQAPLDAAFDTLIAKKLPGSGIAYDVVKRGFFKEVAREAGKGAVTEALTEPAQQAIEIAQADPMKLREFSPEVQRELLNAAAGGALAGGIIGGGADVVGKALNGPRDKAPEQKQLAQDYVSMARDGEMMKKRAEVNNGIDAMSRQAVIGTLRLGKVTIDPTPENGLKVPVDRYKIFDTKNNAIAEFSDPVNATDAVNAYSKITGKKIDILPIPNAKAQPDAFTAADYPSTKPVLEPSFEKAKPSKPKISKAMASAIKNANVAARLQPISAAEIPYSSVKWNEAKKAPEPISGKSKVIDYGGRKIVIADVNGTRVPFYLSSGYGGKTNVPSGKWYPFFGIGPDGWINKTSQDEIANYYGDEDLRRVSETLDATVGDIRKDDTIPRVGLSGEHIDFINSGLDPSENNSPETLDKVTRNIQSVLGRIRANKPVEPSPEPIAGLLPAPVGQEPIGSAEPLAITETGAEAVSEPLPPPAATPPEVELEAAPPVVAVDEYGQEAVRKFIAARKQAVSDSVKDALKRYNLKDVEASFVPAFMDAMGNPRAIEGSEVLSGGKSIVKLATGIYDPSLKTEEMVNKVIDVLNHETIHSLFDLGLLRQSEKSVLLNAVRTAKVPGKQYTYLDRAKAVYDPQKTGMEIYSDPNLVAEEAVAEMFRDWRKNNNGAPPNTRGLFNRVIDTLRHIFNAMRKNSYEDVFKAITTGEVGSREGDSKSNKAATKFSQAPNVDSDEFRNWFAGSKLVDADGGPLKLYTGTSKDTIFETFKDSDRGTWVTSNPKEASSYAEQNDSMGFRRGRGWDIERTNQTSRVIPLYASVKNILDLSDADIYNEYLQKNRIVESPGVNGYQKTQAAVGRAAMRDGYDAIQWGPDVWAVFNPKKNLKSQFNSFTDKSIASQKFAMAPELPKLSVAPNYPYGQQVPEVNAAQINNTLDHITYGAGVDMIDRVMKNRAVNNRLTRLVFPERLRTNKDSYTSFMQKFADRMLPVGQMVDFIKQNGGTVPDAFDAYLAEELMHGKVSDSLESRENDLYKPLIEYIRSSGLSEAEFEDYLYARHAKERNQRMREINPSRQDREGNVIPAMESGSGMSDAEADAILSRVDSAPNKDDFLNAERMMRAIIDDTNALRVEAGLTPDFGNMVDESGNPVEVPQYQYYVPLRGFADETATEGEIDDDLRARIGRGFKIRGREDMRAMGRSSKGSDIIAHAMLQNTEAVVRAAKNKVGQSFLGMVEANPELSAQYGVEVMTQGKKPLKKYISSKGVVKSMVDPMYKNSDDVLVVKRNGEEIPIRIDNRFLQKALLSKKSGNPDIADKAVNTLRWVNRALAAMNTVYNPEFMLVNFPRDLQTAMVNITQYEIDGIQKKVLKDALPAATAVFKMLRDPEAQTEWSDWYKMFKQDGGATSGFFGTFSLEDRLKKLEKMSQDISGQPSHRIKESINFIKGLLEDGNGAFENAVRLSVYKNLVEAGLSRQRAAQAAKNLTVNFDKRGEYGPFLNSLYLFYNASVQGTLSMGMALSRSKKVRKVVAGIVVAGAMQDMINSLFSPEDDDGIKIYDKIPDYKLETNMILMDPFGFTKNGYYAIPLPYGFNAFWNMGRATSRNLRGGYKTSEAATSMASTFIDAFNPIGGTESFLNFISPTVLDPVVALSINKDFTGRKIYPEPFPGSVPKADSQMYWSTTSPLFKTTADYMNWATGGTEYVPGLVDFSPDVMEYIYDYMLGGVGSFARRLYDTSTNTIPALVKGDLTELEINNIPVLRKMYGNVSTRVSFENYFEKVNHVLARGEEMKSAMKEGDPERIKSVRSRFSDELTIYPQVKSLANRRNKLASELRKVRENTRMPPELKRRRQEMLQKQIEDVTTRVNKLYESKIGNKYPSLFS